MLHRTSALVVDHAKRLALFAVALALLLLAAPAMSDVHPAYGSGTTIRLEPAPDVVWVGTPQTTVRIMIDNVTNMSAFQFRLSWNSTLASLASEADVSVYDPNGPLVAPVPFIVSGGRNGSCSIVPDQTDPGHSHSVTYGCYTYAINPSQPLQGLVSGSAELADVTLHVNGPKGTGALALDPNWTYALVPDPVNGGLMPAPATIQSTSLSVMECPDANGDGVVSFPDLLIFARAYGSSVGPPASPNWDSRADFDHNGAVGFTDLLLFATAYGLHC